jgi:hypothetical protein
MPDKLQSRERYGEVFWRNRLNEKIATLREESPRISGAAIYGHVSVELSKIGSEDARIDSVEAEMCR